MPQLPRVTTADDVFIAVNSTARQASFPAMGRQIGIEPALTPAHPLAHP